VDLLDGVGVALAGEAAACGAGHMI
jgi:hypothetical protein